MLIDIDSELWYQYIMVPFLVQMASYWIPSLIFLFCDIYFESKGTIHLYKIQHQSPNWELYPQTILIVLRNQFLVNFPLLILLASFHREYDLRTRELDLSWISWTVRFVILYVISDLFFYWIHRLLHHRSIYKYIHKVHHEWKAPVACRAMYAHPVEHLFGNILPFLLPLYCLNLSWTTLLGWFVMTSINTTIVHSGYLLSFINTEDHDLHHQKFNVNYGVFISDNLFGTFEKGHRQTKTCKDDLENHTDDLEYHKDNLETHKNDLETHKNDLETHKNDLETHKNDLEDDLVEIKAPENYSELLKRKKVQFDDKNKEIIYSWENDH